MNNFRDGEFEIRSNDGFATAQVSKAIGMTLSPYDISFSRWKGGELLGGVVYQRYTQSSMFMNVAGFAPNWINRDFIWLAFHYPFIQLGCERVFGLTHEGNAHALEFERKLGFTIETRIKKVYPDGDQIVLVMERDTCRWLKLKPRTMKDGRG